MPYDGIGQAQCGPFSKKDFPDFAAAISHVHAHYYPVVNGSIQQVIFLHMQLCYMRKDKRRWVHLSWERAREGLPPNPDTGGCGVYPFLGSRSTFFKAIADGKELGLFIENEIGQLAIDYSVRMADLIECDQVQRYAKKSMPRSWGATQEGRETCASMLDEHDLRMYEQEERCSKNKSKCTETMNEAASPQDDGNACSTRTPSTKSFSSQSTEMENISTSEPSRLRMVLNFAQHPIACLAYSMQRWGACRIRVFQGSDYNRTSNQYPSSDKSSEGPLGQFQRPERTLIMRSADELKRAITAAVGQKREKVIEKRKRRRTLADTVKLFSMNWVNGQRELSDNTVPTSITTRRDIKLLKDHIIIPFRDTEMDVVDFAYWCAANWHAIGATHFAKAKSYPRYPNFRWLFACRDRYIEAYAHKDELDHTAVLPPREATKRAERAKDAYEKATASANATVSGLKADLDQAWAEIRRLRDEAGMDPDPDPAYTRGINAVRKNKRKIGKFE